MVQSCSSKGLAEKPVLPSDCLLVVGLPLKKNTFLRSLDCENTYAQSYRSKGESEEDAWDKYAAFREPCRQALARVEALDGQVVFPENPAELLEPGRRPSVVALFTHSTWRPFAPANVRDLDGLIESLMFDSKMTTESFRWFAENEAGSDAGPALTYTGVLLNTLSKASKLSHDWWARNAGEREELAPGSAQRNAYESLCRPEIDRQLGDYIEADRGIELGGTMWGIRELFEPLVKPLGEVIFDLRMCNSSMVVNSVKSLHPKSLVVDNQWLADPVFAMLRYVAVLQELKNHHCSYISACERIVLGTLERFHRP